MQNVTLVGIGVTIDFVASSFSLPRARCTVEPSPFR
jgi:hypothetical protein